MENNAELAQIILSLAKKHGATSSEVHISSEIGFSVNSRLGKVEALEHHNDLGADITVYIGQKTGAVSTDDLTPDALDKVVAKACSIASFTAEDPCAGLAEKALMALEIPDLDLYHPWQLNPQQALVLAIECESQALDMDAQIKNSEGAALTTVERGFFYANSHGFAGDYQTTSHSMNCVLIAGNGQMQRDYEYTVARNKSNLMSATDLAKASVERTVQRLNAKPIKTCQVPILFEARLASGLISNLLAAIYGSSQYRKSSFLLDKLGEKVCAEHINIYQRPHLKGELGSAPFDGEGLATVDRDFVRDGVLQSYIMSSYSARKLKMQPTGNAGGTHNVIVDHHDVDFQGLLKQMQRGLLVTEMMGQGVNYVTGDYSRGAFGFWVENGEIQHPVTGVTIAGNLKNMLMQIVAVGSDVDKRSSIKTGSILIEKMTVAGE